MYILIIVCQYIIIEAVSGSCKSLGMQTIWCIMLNISMVMCSHVTFEGVNLCYHSIHPCVLYKGRPMCLTQVYPHVSYARAHPCVLCKSTPMCLIQKHAHVSYTGVDPCVLYKGRP